MSDRCRRCAKEGEVRDLLCKTCTDECRKLRRPIRVVRSEPAAAPARRRKRSAA